MRGAPPILWTAVGFAAGAAADTVLFIPLLIASVPILLWRGPGSRALSLLLCFLAGLGWGTADRRSREHCTASVRDGAEASVTGYFTSSSAEGASTLRVDPACGGPLRVYTATKHRPWRDL